MKKILLLLSCCLATWCSVQAELKPSAESRMMLNSAYAYGRGYGYIKSATFDKDNNTMFVTYSLSGASSAKLRLLQTRTGEPVEEYSLSVNASSTTFRVDTKFDEGLYVLLLVVDGQVRSDMNVNITATGRINSIKPNGNETVTVNYTIDHASTYSNTIRVYKKNDTGKKNPLMRISLSDPNVVTSKTFSYSNKLTAGTTYTFALYSNDNLLYSKDFRIPTPPIIEAPKPTGELVSVSYSQDDKYSFFADYNLKNATNPTICIYDNGGMNLLDSVKITNSNTTTRFKVSNVVEPSNYYQICICENGKKLTALKQLDTYKVTETNNSISSITYEQGINRILVQFSLKNTGVNVGFEVISTRTGKSYEHTYGRCDQYSSNRFIDLPSEDNGYRYPIIYVVLLKVDGKVVDSKQIAITR